MTTAFRALSLRKVATHVGIGMASASFWRGAWYILDDSLFPSSPIASAIASLTLGTMGMTLSQGLIEKAEALTHDVPSLLKRSTTKRNSTTLTTTFTSKQLTTPTSQQRGRLCIVRFAAIYSVALSCVLVWRGTWILWDVIYDEYIQKTSSTTTTTIESTQQDNDVNTKQPSQQQPSHLLKSGLLSHGIATIGLLTCGLFASVLAPPAAASVIRDLAVKTTSKAATTGPAATPTTQSSNIAAAKRLFQREVFFQNNPRIQRTLHSTTTDRSVVNRKQYMTTTTTTTSHFHGRRQSSLRIQPLRRP